MDILKKLFSSKASSDEEKPNNNSQFHKNFNKPWRFDDFEKDDEFSGKNNPFNFHITITNPNEMQSYFESVIQDAFKSLENFDEQLQIFDEENPYNSVEPGFENENKLEDKEIEPHKAMPVLRESSELLKSFFNGTDTPMRKQDMSEFDQVMNIIHGMVPKEEPTPKRNKFGVKTPGFHNHHKHSNHPFSNEPHSNVQFYGKSVITQIKRMPDGSYETQQTIRDADGTTKTTRTRTVDGQTKVLEKSVTDDRSNGYLDIKTASPEDNNSIFMLRNGYIMPKNMW